MEQFIPKARGKRALTKERLREIHPNAKYSGKTLYDKEGKVVRGPGFYVP